MIHPMTMLSPYAYSTGSLWASDLILGSCDSLLGECDVRGHSLTCTRMTCPMKGADESLLSIFTQIGTRKGRRWQTSDGMWVRSAAHPHPSVHPSMIHPSVPPNIEAFPSWSAMEWLAPSHRSWHEMASCMYVYLCHYWYTTTSSHTLARSSRIWSFF